MGLLSKLIPTNILEQKEHFFADQTYNPQFVYEEAQSISDLTQYGKPKKEYVALAEAIVSEAYFGRNEDDLWMMEGRSLSQSEVEQKVTSFLTMHGLEQRYHIVWSSSFITRASINKDTVKLRLPVFFRREGLLGMIYHEIGTHALRRINYEQQPWYKKKKTYGFSEYLPTEEGLASLHGLLPRSFQSAFNTALRYLAVEHGQKGSFVQVWNYLKPYVQDEQRRWEIVFRQKRGMTDTSQPGGFSKDLTYFEGMIQVWQWLKSHDFTVAPLYYGKLALSDVDEAVALNPDFKPLLPSFVTLNPHKYAKHIESIGNFNHFDQL